MTPISSSSATPHEIADLDDVEQARRGIHEMHPLAPSTAQSTSTPRPPDKRPPHLHHEGAEETANTQLYAHTDEPEDPHMEIAPTRTMLADLAPRKIGPSTALQQLHRDMREVGVERDEFDTLVHGLSGRYVESASAGVSLATLNDHVGIASFAFKFRSVTVATNLLVVKDSVDDAEGKSDLYFIKGYAHRLVSLRDVCAFEQHYERFAQAERHAIEGAPGKGKAGHTPTEMMETYFCSYLLELSRKSVVCARRTVDESSTIVMPVPPNAAPFPRQFAWANAENYMANRFGERPAVAGRQDYRPQSDFSLGYSDYNSAENRNIIFITAQKYHERARPMQNRPYGQYPASLNVGGGAIAEITGFDAEGVEIMGPAGQVPGVKMATIRQVIDKFLAEPQRKLTLIVRTEDQYRHKFEHTSKGLTMTLLDQHGDPVKALSPLPGADVSVYGWQGNNTGPFGNPGGYANTMLVVSTGEAVPAGPFLKDRHSLKGIATAASHAVVDLILNDMTPAVKGTAVNGALRTAMRAAVTAATVYGMTALMNSLRDEKTHALFEGAQPFSASGRGVVDAKTLAGAIAVTVLAQDVVSVAYRFAYKNFVKDTAKGREKFTGQVFNEAILPFLGELGRLLVNYGIQKGMGLPRGNENDIYSLVGVATMLTAIDFLRNRSGDPDNHLFLSALYKTMDFFAADLVFRTIGAVFGTEAPALVLPDGEQMPNNLGKNILEAYVSRMGSRALDKYVFPVAAMVMAGAGLAGDHARAGEDQLARENAAQNLVARVRNVINVFSVDAERLLETGRDKIEDVEGLRRAAVMLKRGVNDMRMAINHLNLDTPNTHAGELAQVRDAARFPDMSEQEQMAHLQAVAQRFEQMIEASDVFSGRAQLPALPEAAVGPSSAPDLSLAVSNSSAALPKRIREQVELLMKTFPATYAANKEIIYPTSVAPDFLGTALPHTAKPPSAFAKTERLLRDFSTFTTAQVGDVKEMQRALDKAPGMPRRIEDSRPMFRQLTHRMIDEGGDSVHVYSLESQLFHYLLRWAQTGQAKYLRLAAGVYFKIAAMNHRGNVTGDRDRFVTPLSVLLVNAMLLHGQPVPHVVHRAVVTDAHYIEHSRQEAARKIYGEDAVFIGEGAIVGMSEIMSVTSSTEMTATFLQGLGHGAAPLDRSNHLVIKQEVAVPARRTEHQQVESLIAVGGVAVVRRIDANPPPLSNRDVKQKRKTGELSGSGEDQEFNLGQTVYMEMLDTFAAQLHYHHYLEARQAAQESGHALQFDLPDGEICCHPDTAQLYRYDAGLEEMVFTGGTLNYFHGAPQEPDATAPARWRNPFMAAQSPAQMRIGALGLVLTSHSSVPYLNDMTRNVSHEFYRIKGGYYDPASPNHKYKLADDARRDAMKKSAARAIREILAWTPQTTFSLPAPGRPFVDGKPFPGELLAHTISGALLRPVMIMEVDASGALVMEYKHITDHRDRPRTQSQPVVRRDLGSTNTLLDLQYDAQRTPMIGVGPKGYYVVALHLGEYRAVPVNIAGEGLRAGNLMHAFLALAYPNPNRSRYTVKSNEIKSATALAGSWRKLVPGQSDHIANSAGDMLKRLRNVAKSDFDPVDAWLDQTYTALHGPMQDEPAAPPGGKKATKT